MEVDELPEGFGIEASWYYKDGEVLPVPADYSQLAEKQRQHLLTEAKDITSDWKTELELGVISDDDKARLVQWMAYIKAVKALDLSAVTDEASLMPSAGRSIPMPQLKGVIKTPTGEPLGGATITLTSLHNRAGILKGVFSHVTTQSGEYDFPVLPGVYSVRLTQSAQRLSEIGIIRVYEDSQDGSLNDFLSVTDADLRPESLKSSKEIAMQIQKSAKVSDYMQRR